jgi:hypothetical protein
LESSTQLILFSFISRMASAIVVSSGMEMALC